MDGNVSQGDTVEVQYVNSISGEEREKTLTVVGIVGNTVMLSDTTSSKGFRYYTDKKDLEMETQEGSWTRIGKRATITAA